MKKLISTSFVIIILSLTCLSQVSHSELIYDFEGDDFEYAVNGMVGTNDSLYIICNTRNGQGKFFRIDEHGTTRFSSAVGGTLFEYSLVY